MNVTSATVIVLVSRIAMALQMSEVVRLGKGLGFRVQQLQW